MQRLDTIIRHAMKDAGIAPETADQVMAGIVYQLVAQGLTTGGPRAVPHKQHLAGQYLEQLRAALNFDAPKHLWKWRTAADIGRLAGLKPTRSQAMAVAAALHALGCTETRKTNGRLLRFAPPAR